MIRIKQGAVLDRAAIERLAASLAGTPRHNPIMGRIHYQGGHERLLVTFGDGEVTFDPAPAKSLPQESER